MIPLNEYPKEELQWLLRAIDSDQIWTSKMRLNWIQRLNEAISDQEFSEKELPFKTE